MGKYAQLIVRSKSKSIDDLFTYEIPQFLLEDLKVGHRVLVPFGKGNKPTEGFVFGISDELSFEAKRLKQIIDVLDENPMLKIEDIDLIKWMRNRYLCTYMECINLMYPKGYKLSSYRVISLGKKLKTLNDTDLYIETEKLGKIEREVVEKIISNKGELKVDNIESENFNINTLYKMNKDNLINLSWSFESKVNEKKVCYVSLAIEKTEIDEYIDENKIKVTPLQRNIINFLKNNDDVEINDLLDLLSVHRQSIQSLHKKNLINLEIRDYYRQPKQLCSYKNKTVELNEEQVRAVEKVTSEMFNEDKNPYMINGVTGSGKTEVYMEIIEYALSQGLDSIFLVPEISLTPQVIARLKNRFGSIVGVFHSKLSEGQKHDVYREIKEGNVRILIGPRSALFAPFNSLGLIIIDEFHESSYKSEQNPKFNAIEVARYMGIKNNISVVLGSATPSIDEYYKAQLGQYNLINIKERANKKQLPKIEVVDMKRELTNGNKSIFSFRLQQEIKQEIEKNNQVILFLNRRGYANFVSCRSCGFLFTCENCDISLTYHKKNNTGRCHYCGYEVEIPTECPECGSEYLKPFGVGTQKIEEELKDIFPDVNILRVDKDNTSKKGQLEDILSKFEKREAQILIGTQMISKGLDFDNVTLVGILSADMMLNFPDFKSFETTFQLITQVSGRAGRATKEGRVILQTYDTNHYAIRRAINYDFEGFYEDEIKIRKAFGYTPFNNMLSVVISGKNENEVIACAKNMHDSLVYLLKNRGINNFDFILGPNPCSISKIDQNYRWQLLFKDDNIEINLLKGIIKYICITKREIVFTKGVNISIDINPNSVL